MLDRDDYWGCLDAAQEASSDGRIKEALDWLEAALRANPKGAEAHNGRGEIFWDNGRFEEALREFDRAVEANADFHPAHLNRIEILIEEFQEYEQALDLCDELLHASMDRGVEAEIYNLKAKALFYLDDLEGALFLVRRANRTFGEGGIDRGFEGQILYEMGEFDAARRALERAERLDPEGAHAAYYLALVLEHQGETGRAESLYARAAHLQPDFYPLPVTIEEDEFRSVAEEALTTLPDTVRRYVENCPVIVEDLPDAELVQRERISPQTLGLFQGVPATEPGASPTLGTGQVRSDTDRILLFKRNLERMALSREHLVEEIQITLKHEIGHYLGLDEDEVERLGLG